MPTELRMTIQARGEHLDAPATVAADLAAAALAQLRDWEPDELDMRV